MHLVKELLEAASSLLLFGSLLFFCYCLVIYLYYLGFGLFVIMKFFWQKWNGMGIGKIKGTHMKHSKSHQDIEDEALELSKVSEGEIVSPTIFHDNTSSSLCSMSMLGQSESSNYDVAVDAKISQCPSGGGDNLASSTGITCEADKEQVFVGRSDNDCRDCDSVHGSTVFKDDVENSANLTNLDTGPPAVNPLPDASFDHDKKHYDGRLLEYECLECLSAANHDIEHEKNSNDNGTERSFVPDSVVYTPLSKMLDHDRADSFECNEDLGDWRVYWDSFYKRNYFYNIKTYSSTWYPPPGMEHLAYGDINNKSNEESTEATEMDVCPVAEVTDLCTLQTKIDLFEESISNGKLGGQPPDELAVGIGHGADSSMSCVDVTTASRSLEHTDELYEINRSSVDVNTSCLLPNSLEHIDRYFFPISVCVFLYIFIKFCIYTCVNLPDKCNKIISCVVTHEDDEAFQVFDISR